MNFHPDERVVVFIDGANLHAATRGLGFVIDYKKLLNLLQTRGRLVRALYYTTVFDDDEFSSVRPLTDWLDYNGFTLVTKTLKSYVDAEGRRKAKGNMAVELAVDAMQLSDRADHIVLFTGDATYCALVSALKHRGKRVSVVSTLMSSPPMMSDELRRQADQFVELGTLEPIIGREQPASRAPRTTANADQDER